jgi:hypothetical protein
MSCVDFEKRKLIEDSIEENKKYQIISKNKVIIDNQIYEFFSTTNRLEDKLYGKRFKSVRSCNNAILSGRIINYLNSRIIK